MEELIVMFSNGQEDWYVECSKMLIVEWEYRFYNRDVFVGKVDLRDVDCIKPNY